jgi:hypothetical protein
LSPRTSAAALCLSEKAVLDLGVDLMKPLLRAIGSLLLRSDVSFQLCNSILGCAQLMQQLLRHLNRVPAVLLGNNGRPIKKLQDCLAGFIELIVFALRALSGARKWDDLWTGCRVVPVAVHV